MTPAAQLDKAGELSDARTACRLLARLGAKKAKSSAGRVLPLLRTHDAVAKTFEDQQRFWLKQFAEVEAGLISCHALSFYAFFPHSWASHRQT